MSAYLDKLPGTGREQALVFFPIWTLDYVHEGKRYQVVIDGSSGEVFASEFPTRSSSAYMAVAGLGFVAFVAEGYAAIFNIWLGLGLMAVTVIGIYFTALYVARRM